MRRTGARIIATAFALSLSVATVSLAEPPETCRVKYLSAEHVYLDAGRLAGIDVGDTLEVRRDDSRVAILEVVYAADHSASCTVLVRDRVVETGDEVLLDGVVPSTRSDEPGAAASTRTRSFDGIARTDGDSGPDRLHGRLALQWHQSHENSRGSFRQPTIRLDLKYDDPVGAGSRIEVKGYLRHIHRGGSGTGLAPRSEYRNRLHRVSLTHATQSGSIRYAAGRISSAAVSGLGWLDGLLVDGRLKGNLRAGVFAGWLPDWNDTEPATAVRKIGFFARRDPRQGRGRGADVVLAAIGQYAGSEISREYLHLATRLPAGRLSLAQSLDLELNRDWRRDLAGETFSVTNLYLSGRYRASDRLTASLGYDQRRRYRSHETRSLPDSLFGDAARYGLRLRGHYRAGDDWTLQAGAGLRHHDALSDDATSWQAGITRHGGLGPGTRILLTASGFDGPSATGWSPSLEITRPWRDGQRLRLGAGLYSYDDGRGGETRSNRWVSGGGEFGLSSRIYGACEYRHDWGDDILGHRVYAELGVRF